MGSLMWLQEPYVYRQARNDKERRVKGKEIAATQHSRFVSPKQPYRSASSWELREWRYESVLAAPEWIRSVKHSHRVGNAAHEDLESTIAFDKTAMNETSIRGWNEGKKHKVGRFPSSGWELSPIQDLFVVYQADCKLSFGLETFPSNKRELSPI